MVFFLFKFSFRDLIHDMLKDEDYFRVFESKARSDPLRVSLIIRFLYIPQIYKNFFLCVFNVPLRDFMWPALVQYLPYLSLPLLIGSNLKNLSDFYHRGHIPNSRVYYSVLVFFGFFLLSLGLLGYLTWFAYTELTRAKQDHLKELQENHKEGERQTHVEKDIDTVSRAESSKILKMDN